MSRTNSKVTDLKLFLTYFSGSNKFLEALLATYLLHKSSDQIQNGGKCLGQLWGMSWTVVGNVLDKAKVTDLHLFSTTENVRKTLDVSLISCLHHNMD